MLVLLMDIKRTKKNAKNQPNKQKETGSFNKAGQSKSSLNQLIETAYVEEEYEIENASRALFLW